MSQVTLGQRLQGHLAMARISNSPTLFTNVLVGSVIGGATLGRDWQILFLLSMSILAFYTGGMYLNDICDYEIDLKERSNRPLITGTIAKMEAWIVTIFLFGIGLGILAWIQPSLLISGLILLGFIVLYDVWHKGNILSPLVMGANRFMVYMIAYLAFQPVPTAEIIIPGLFLWSYIIGITLIAKSENRESFTQYWPILVLLAPVLYQFVDWNGLSLVTSILFIGWVLYCAHLIFNENKIKYAVAFLIAGICLLDGLFLAQQLGLIGLLIAAAGFGATLFFQQYIKGT